MKLHLMILLLVLPMVLIVTLFNVTEVHAIDDEYVEFNAQGWLNFPASVAGHAVHPDVLYFPNGVGGYKYWMYFEWQSVRTGLVRSNDGINWVDQREVLNYEGSGRNGMHDPEVLRVSANDWRMWWTPSSTGGGNPIEGIFYATSTNGINWVHRGEVISGRVLQATIVKLDSTYHMWYGKAASNGAICYATSSNGVSWQTQSGVFRDPSGSSHHPDVVYDSGNGRFVMYYVSNPNLKVAFSNNGNDWSIQATVLTRSGLQSITPDAGYLYRSCWSNNTLFYSSRSLPLFRIGYATPPPSYDITISSSPAGSGFVEVDGMPIITPTTYSWRGGRQHVINAVSTNTLGDVRFNFQAWTDGGLQSHTYTVTNHDDDVTAYFTTEYRLTIESPYGSVVGDGWFSEGITTPFLVNPSQIETENTKRTCVGYSGSEVGDIPMGSITMDAPKHINFIWATQYYLIVNSLYGTLIGENWYVEDELATFSISPIEIDYGNGTTRTCTGYSGDATGNPPTGNVIMNTPKEITFQWQSHYTPFIDTISFESNIHTIIIDGMAHLPSQLPRDFQWERDTQHIIEIEERTIYIGEDIFTFTQWSDGNSQTQRTITVGGATSYTIEYSTSTIQYYLDLFASPDLGKVNGGGAYASGSTAQFNIDLPAGYAMDAWKEDGNAITTKTSGKIVMDRNHTLTAFLSEIPTEFVISISIGGIPTTDSIELSIDGKDEGKLRGGESEDFVVSLGKEHRVSITNIIGGINSRYYCKTSTVVMTEQNSTHTFEFILQHYLILSSDPSDISLKGTGWYPNDTLVEISAPQKAYTEKEELTFQFWSGDASIEDNQSAITIVEFIEPVELTAVFEKGLKQVETLSVIVTIERDGMEVDGAVLTIIGSDNNLVYYGTTSNGGVTEEIEMEKGVKHTLIVEEGGQQYRYTITPTEAGSYNYILKKRNPILNIPQLIISYIRLFFQKLFGKVFYLEVPVLLLMNPEGTLPFPSFTLNLLGK